MVEQILGPAGVASTRAPIESATGLPNAAYTDSAWLALENERLFARSWVFAAAAAELPEDGSQLPVEVAGSPILLVRRQGDVLGFHNVCRHRGAELVEAPCTRANIRCPYHHWTYSLDGHLRARPHFTGPGRHERFGEAGNPDLDLFAVHTAEWNGCVFVNLTGEAPPLDDWLAPLDRLAPAHDFGTIRWAGKLSFTVEANWKFVYENYMEGYHVFAVHPRLLEHAPMATRRSGEWTGPVFHNGYVAPELTPGRGGGLPHYPGLSDEETRTGMWFLRFPQFAAEVFADQFTVLSARPLSPARTVEELHVFVIGDEAATGSDHETNRRELIEMWDQLNREDIGVLERLQRGRRSPAYDGGHLSPHWEGPTHELGRRIVDAIIADRVD